MGIGIHNEKTFVWNDTKISTVYSLSSQIYNSSSMHRHSHYELFLFETGAVTISTTHLNEQRMTKGHAMIIPPTIDHHVSKFDNASIMCIAFNFTKVSDHKRQGSSRVYHYFEKHFASSDAPIILKDKFFSDFVTRFRTESEADPVLAQALINNMMEELFLKILRLVNKRTSKTEEVPLYSYKSAAISNETILAKNIEDYMNLPGCTLTILAEKLNMCPRNTQKVLKKIYGKSFSELSAQQRLKRAIHLMKNTDMSLAEVARCSHYNQYASFRKAFILHFGVSPQEYRRTGAEPPSTEE